MHANLVRGTLNDPISKPTDTHDFRHANNIRTEHTVVRQQTLKFTWQRRCQG